MYGMVQLYWIAPVHHTSPRSRSDLPLASIKWSKTAVLEHCQLYEITRS